MPFTILFYNLFSIFEKKKLFKTDFFIYIMSNLKE